MTGKVFVQASGAGLEFAPGGSVAMIPVLLFGWSGTHAIPINVSDTGSLAVSA